jgi:hypothetical protein
VGSRHALCIAKKGALDSQTQIYQLHAHGRWFSPGTPASSTTKTGRHDIAEILLKVELSTNNQSIKTLWYIQTFHDIAESGVKRHKSNQIKLFHTISYNRQLLYVNVTTTMADTRTRRKCK